MNITLVFDVYGHPNQSFWFSFYQRLKGFPEINVKVLAAYNEERAEENILPLKTKTFWEKVYSVARYLISYRQLEKHTLREFIRYPNLIADTNHVVHLLNAQQYPSVSAALAHKKLIFSFRGYETLVRPHTDKEWLASLMKIYNDASILHFVSQDICSEAIKLGADINKCRVIYRSVDSDFFGPSTDYSIKCKPCQIITIGRLTWQKGYIYALECIRRLIDSGYDVNYHIIGEGPDLQQLVFHTNRLGLIARVHFQGFLSKEQIRERLDSATIYFHPAVTDAMPNSVLEASSMALPIVASKAGGIPEAVIHDRTGFLAPVGDVGELAKHIIYLIENQDVAKNMGLAGRQHVVEKFGSQREMEEWVNVYQKLMHS